MPLQDIADSIGMGRESLPFGGFDNFGQIVSAAAIQRADVMAFTFLHDAESATGETGITFAQVGRRAKSVAQTLKQSGFTGERALLLFPPGLEFITALFGCLSGGVVAVPAYPPRAKTSDNQGSAPRPDTGPVQRLKAIIADAKPAVALTTSKLLSTVTEALVGTGISCIAIDAIPDAAADAWVDPQTPSDALAVFQYTSGSTSTPKGVMLTHGNLLSNCAAIGKAFDASIDSRVVLWLPPYHDMGLLGAILMPMYTQSRSWLMAPASFIQKPIRWLQAIGKYQATHTGSPNFGYDFCARSISPQDRATLDLSSLKIAFSGAEPIDPATLDRFSEAFAPAGFRKETFLPCYGLAEATLMVAARPSSTAVALHDVPASALAEGAARVVSCGPAGDQITVSIVDPETFKPVAKGDLGEIWVSSPGVAAGYWNNAELTEKTFKARHADGTGPFLRTGDLGFLSDTGLCVAGRIKDLIIIRGIKHFPQDIERSIQVACEALRDGFGAAFTITDDQGQELLVIAQEVERAHRNDDPAEMLASIRQIVSDQHGLEVYAIALLRPGQFPKTTSGKVQRRACREKFLKKEFDLLAESQTPQSMQKAVEYTENAGENASASTGAESLEEWLIQRLASAVGVDSSEIDPSEPFARYGLDSVKGVALAGEIAEHMGHDVPAMALWDYPSISQLAAYLAESTAQTKAA